MRIIRAFFSNISNLMSTVTIKGDYYNYFNNVLRLKKDEIIILFNNKDGFEYHTKIMNITKICIVLNIIDINKIDNENNYKINLYQSIIKNSNFEFAIQKATELGVNNIYPTITKYSNIKLNCKSFKIKINRWQKIAVAASEQSKRVFIPKIFDPIKLETLQINKNELNITLCPYTLSDDDIFHKIQLVKTINLFIGPEGGFNQDEINFFKNNQVNLINLGKRVLKAETVPINIISIINFLKK